MLNKHLKAIELENKFVEFLYFHLFHKDLFFVWYGAYIHQRGLHLLYKAVFSVFLIIQVFVSPEA